MNTHPNKQHIRTQMHADKIQINSTRPRTDRKRKAKSTHNHREMCVSIKLKIVSFGLYVILHYLNIPPIVVDCVESAGFEMSFRFLFRWIQFQWNIISYFFLFNFLNDTHTIEFPKKWTLLSKQQLCKQMTSEIIFTWYYIGNFAIIYF